MSTPAGWYDDGSGRNRWWDGQQWTEQYADAQQARTPGILSNLTSKHDHANEPGTLWSAVGKPLTGLGAGRYRLTDEYLVFETGTLSTKSQQIRVHEIFDVDATQTLTQKARGIGTITLAARRAGGDEKVALEDIPDFREGVAIINRTADEARHRLLARQNTQHVNHSGAVGAAAAPAAAPSSAAPSPGSDLNAELARLVEFRQQGVLTEDEFAAAKRRLLGL